MLSNHPTDQSKSNQSFDDKKRKKKEKKEKKKKQKLEKILNDLENKGAKQSQEELVSSIFSQERDAQFDHSNLELKPDHQSRPIWVCSGVDGKFHIFMETSSPIYQQAYDFIVAIAEPVSRPENLHEYVLSDFSLYAAVSIGMNTEQIIQVLEKLSKVKLSDSLINFIRQVTTKYGNVKLIVQKNKFFVESLHLPIMEKLYQDKIISSAALFPNPKEFPNIDKSKRFIIRTRSKQSELEKFQKQALASNTSSTLNAGSKIQTEMIRAVNQIGDEDSDDDDDEFDISSSVETYYMFEIDPKQVEDVKKQCIEIGHPTLEEYDFRNDTTNKSLKIDLKPTTTIRSYQEKSLSKMFSNGRARSGIIVLPCGAGKTLVGVTAACTVKKNTLVLCINSVSVLQWKNQFRLWSTVDENRVVVFTSQEKDELPKDDDPVIIIATYSMISYSGKRSGKSKEIMDYIESREWGLMVLDEVHVLPAEMFKTVIGIAKSHCKLGLTATLLREDNKVDNLNYLIGPKLYEANWLDLQQKGHLANVQCVEVWCPMTAEFYAEYLTSNSSKKRLLYVMNPNKFRACEFLIRYHEKQGDKTIVFSDNVFALQEYAEKLQVPYIYGKTKEQERVYYLNQFRNTNHYNTIFISKVGDTAIDIPEASVIIQISSHFGSRRQEAQRLGRILRPKGGGLKNQQAYFYTLVSQDTQEMFFSTKRQQYLINQGYSFRVLPDIQKFYNQGSNEMNLTLKHMKTKKEELDMLSIVKRTDDARGKEEKVNVDDELKLEKNPLTSYSGGSGIVYHQLAESSSSSSQTNTRKKANLFHPLFKSRTQKKD